MHRSRVLRWPPAQRWTTKSVRGRHAGCQDWLSSAINNGFLITPMGRVNVAFEPTGAAGSDRVPDANGATGPNPLVTSSAALGRFHPHSWPSVVHSRALGIRRKSIFPTDARVLFARFRRCRKLPLQAAPTFLVKTFVIRRIGAAGSGQRVSFGATQAIIGARGYAPSEELRIRIEDLNPVVVEGLQNHTATLVDASSSGQPAGPVINWAVCSERE